MSCGSPVRSSHSAGVLVVCSGRNLTWQTNMGTVDLKATFDKRYEFQVRRFAQLSQRATFGSALVEQPSAATAAKCSDCSDGSTPTAGSRCPPPLPPPLAPVLHLSHKRCLCLRRLKQQLACMADLLHDRACVDL